nr:twin-arginine translocation signal domain-containing protein [Planctomycetota bacterium]
MKRSISRRDLIRMAGASGLAAGFGGLLSNEDARAQPAVREMATPGVHVTGAGTKPAVVVDGRVIQPERELSVLHKTQVLVVGAGPAGVVAALAA